MNLKNVNWESIFCWAALLSFLITMLYLLYMSATGQWVPGGTVGESNMAYGAYYGGIAAGI